MIEVNRLGSSPAHQAFAAQEGFSLLGPPESGLTLLERMTHVSLQAWGEHCTECAAPDCHFTCDLFERGSTGLCRRFVDGLVVRPCRGAAVPYTFEAIFKPSARLLSVGNTLCVSRPRHARGARALLYVSRFTCILLGMLRWMPGRVRWRATDLVRGALNRIPRLLNKRRAARGGARPDAFVAVIGNPADRPVTVDLSASGFGDSQGGRLWRCTRSVPHGWHSFEISFDEVAAVIDPARLFRLSVTPQIETPTLLQFLYIGFVRLRAPSSESSNPPAALGAVPRRKRSGRAGHPIIESPSAPKVKLLVTDLDNTLWDGTLVEDPDKEYALRPGVREALTALDERGILLSIASKNNPEDAQKQLEQLGLWDLFLHPQITWGPKSESVRCIVDALNIGEDTVAFIDDSEFERAEVTAAVPSVRAFDADAFADLSSQEAFDVPVTDESRRRRGMYRNEQHRARTFEKARVDYDEFLFSCETTLSLEAYDETNRDRVLELVQRTNQLNFSGNRYSRESLETLLAEPGVVPVVMRCGDRFGDYGIIGFAILALRDDIVEITDLMFSCRVQGKKVEHSFLAHVLHEAEAGGYGEVRCVLKETVRNRPATRVFSDLGFERTSEATTTVARITLPAAELRDKAWPVSVKADIALSTDAGMLTHSAPGDKPERLA